MTEEGKGSVADPILPSTFTSPPENPLPNQCHPCPTSTPLERHPDDLSPIEVTRGSEPPNLLREASPDLLLLARVASHVHPSLTGPRDSEELVSPGGCIVPEASPHLQHSGISVEPENTLMSEERWARTAGINAEGMHPFDYDSTYQLTEAGHILQSDSSAVEYSVQAAPPEHRVSSLDPATVPETPNNTALFNHSESDNCHNSHNSYVETDSPELGFGADLENPEISGSNLSNTETGLQVGGTDEVPEIKTEPMDEENSSTSSNKENRYDYSDEFLPRTIKLNNMRTDPLMCHMCAFKTRHLRCMKHHETVCGDPTKPTPESMQSIPRATLVFARPAQVSQHILQVNQSLMKVVYPVPNMQGMQLITPQQQQHGTTVADMISRSAPHRIILPAGASVAQQLTSHGVSQQLTSSNAPLLALPPTSNANTPPNQHVMSCQLCRFNTINGSALEEHVRKHHSPLYSCNYCTFRTSIQQDIQNHLEMECEHRPPKCYTCVICNVVMSSLEGIEKHFQAMHPQINTQGTLPVKVGYGNVNRVIHSSPTAALSNSRNDLGPVVQPGPPPSSSVSEIQPAITHPSAIQPAMTHPSGPPGLEQHMRISTQQAVSWESYSCQQCRTDSMSYVEYDNHMRNQHGHGNGKGAKGKIDLRVGATQGLSLTSPAFEFNDGSVPPPLVGRAPRPIFRGQQEGRPKGKPRDVIDDKIAFLNKAAMKKDVLCEVCDFRTNKTQNLKRHMLRMHKEHLVKAAELGFGGASGTQGPVSSGRVNTTQQPPKVSPSLVNDPIYSTAHAHQSQVSEPSLTSIAIMQNPNSSLANHLRTPSHASQQYVSGYSIQQHPQHPECSAAAVQPLTHYTSSPLPVTAKPSVVQTTSVSAPRVAPVSSLYAPSVAPISSVPAPTVSPASSVSVPKVSSVSSEPSLKSPPISYIPAPKVVPVQNDLAREFDPVSSVSTVPKVTPSKDITQGPNATCPLSVPKLTSSSDPNRPSTAIGKVVSCQYCENKMLDASLLRHMKSQHPEMLEMSPSKRFRCHHCSFKSNSELGLKRHTGNKHGPSSLTQMGSGEEKKGVKREVPQQPKPKNFSCSHCEFKTTSSWSLKRHTRTHMKVENMEMNSGPVVTPASKKSVPVLTAASKTSAPVLTTTPKTSAPVLTPAPKNSAPVITPALMDSVPVLTPASKNSVSVLNSAPAKRRRKSEPIKKDRIDGSPTKSTRPLREYSCPHCMFKTNYLHNIKRHIDRVHLGKRPSSTKTGDIAHNGCAPIVTSIPNPIFSGAEEAWARHEIDSIRPTGQGQEHPSTNTIHQWGPPVSTGLDRDMSQNAGILSDPYSEYVGGRCVSPPAQDRDPTLNTAMAQHHHSFMDALNSPRVVSYPTGHGLPYPGSIPVVRDKL